MIVAATIVQGVGLFIYAAETNNEIAAAAIAGFFTLMNTSLTVYLMRDRRKKDDDAYEGPERRNKPPVPRKHKSRRGSMRSSSPGHRTNNIREPETEIKDDDLPSAAEDRSDSNAS
jgi:hypothetical protein